MSDVRFLEAERHGPDESLKLGWLAGEVLTDEGDLGHHAFPPLPSAKQTVLLQLSQSKTSGFYLPQTADTAAQTMGIIYEYPLLCEAKNTHFFF